eukprot:g1450.t1
MMEIKVAGRVEGADVSESMVLVGLSHLAGNNWDGSLQVFSSSGDLLTSIQRSSGCSDVCWTKLGHRAVCAEDSGNVKVYTMDQDAPARLAEVASLEEHDDIVSTLAASHSHNGLVLSGSYDRSIKVWDIGSDRHVSLGTFTGHSGNVTGVEWTAEDNIQVFASSSSDCSVRVWDRRQAQGCCGCHWLGAPALSISSDPYSKVLLAVGCEDGTVAVLDKRALSFPVSIQRTHKGRVNGTAFGPAAGGDSLESARLASVGDDGELAIRRLGEGSCRRFALHSDYAQALVWRSGTTLISGGWDSRLCFIDLEKPSV